MAFRIYINGNTFYIQDTSDGDRLYEGHAKDVLLRRENLTSTNIAFTNVNNWDRTRVIDFNTDVDLTGAEYTDFSTFVTWCDDNTGKSSGGGNGEGLTSQVVVTQSNYQTTLANIDSSKSYFIDGVVDLGSFQIIVPVNGMTITGYSFDISGLISSEANYSMFIPETALIGSGNLLITDCYLTTNGAKSKVLDLLDSDGTHAIELNRVNFINCSSIGIINGYRQYLESGTGRFGGKCDLTFDGVMNGARISTSIARNISSNIALFIAGASLSFSGRFITDINADLNTLGALFDFSDANFVNDESLIIKGTFVARNGVLDTSDTTIYPNIDQTNVKSLWSDNTGVPNTNKYIKSNITTEITTTVSAINTYYPLEGTFTVDTSSHFDMPSNGEFRLLSGNGQYQITGDFVLDSNPNNEVDIRITKSTDNGITFPIEINHIKRSINSFVGGRDVGFFPINFIANLKEGDRIRVEVENKTATNDITAELDSYIIISQI